MILTYFGGAVTQRTDGWIRPFANADYTETISWEGLRQILQKGEPVEVRQPSSVEVAFAESMVAIYRAKGGRFDFATEQA